MLLILSISEILLMDSGFRVFHKHTTLAVMPLLASEAFWTNLAFTCKTGTLGPLYSHALLILTKSSKSKNQVVHEQKFKDLLSRTCLTRSGRRVLDLETEVMRGLGSMPTGGNILSFEFFCFFYSKASDANIGIIAKFF